MKLEYKILWFEDNPEIVDDLIGPGIKNYLDSLGFVYQCTHRENGDNLDEMIENKNYDLILTDLNLGEEHETGEKVVKHIRDGNILTEVLLYSADESGINRVIENTDHLIERVSFSVGIEHLAGKTNEIIDLTIKKVQDIRNMRGLVISEAIDLENKMKEILQDYLRLLDENGNEVKLQKLLEDIFNKKIIQQDEQLDEIKALGSVNIGKFIEEGIFTANDISKSIKDILKNKHDEVKLQLSQSSMSKENKEKVEIKLKRISAIKKDFKTFWKEIINMRNTLAHVKEQTDEDGVPFLESRNKESDYIIRFDSEKYIEIRKNFKKHSENIDKARELILKI